MNKNIFRAITKDASAVVSVIDGTNIVGKIEEYHSPSAAITAALGRLSVAASLMGYNLKGKDESLTLQINADGPAGVLVAVSDSGGNVRCYAGNYICELPLNNKGKLDVAGVVGKNGTLSVIKDLKLKEPYIGQVSLVSGEIAEDIGVYFAESEQTPTVCALGVLIAPDLRIINAGGYLINLLPFASDEVIDIIEKNVAALPPVTELLKTDTPEQIAFKLFDGLEPNELDTAFAEYKCTCSRERTEKILIAFGREELLSLKDENEITEVECHFCNKVYRFTRDDIQNLADSS